MNAEPPAGEECLRPEDKGMKLSVRQRQTNSGDNRIPLSIFGRRIIANTQCIYPLARLPRLYQVLSFRMLDTAKKRGVTRLY